jgi:phosphoglycerol transferase
VAQVGAFGSLFSPLVSPEIRAYNRIVVFIAFFSLLAAGLGFERLQTLLIRRCPARAALIHGGVLLTLLLAVLDQATTTALRGAHASYARQFDVHREFVSRLESRLPRGAMVFQLSTPRRPSTRWLLE